MADMLVPLRLESSPTVHSMFCRFSLTSTMVEVVAPGRMIDEIPSEAAPARWRELLSTRHLFATVTVSLGIVLFAFNAFLVSTALPSAVTDLGGAELLSWATSLYLIFAIVGGSSTV